LVKCGHDLLSIPTNRQKEGEDKEIEGDRAPYRNAQSTAKSIVGGGKKDLPYLKTFMPLMKERE